VSDGVSRRRRACRLGIRLAVVLMLALAPGAVAPSVAAAPLERCVASPGTAGDMARGLLELADGSGPQQRQRRELARRLARQLRGDPLVGPIEVLRDKLLRLGYDAGEPLELVLLSAAGTGTRSGTQASAVRAAKLASAVRAFATRHAALVPLALLATGRNVPALLLLESSRLPLEAALDAELAQSALSPATVATAPATAVRPGSTPRCAF
jgi:hypothetical protein